MFVAGEVFSDRNTVNQAVTNSTVLVNAGGATYAAVAGKAVYIRFHAMFNLAGAVSGYKFQLIMPAVTSFNCSYTIFSNISTLIDSKIQNITNPIQAVVAAGDYYIKIEALVLPSASGNITVQFAQSVANANAITINVGSIFMAVPSS